MSWSYNPVMSAEKDQVRFLIQDTNSGRQLIQDEEIVWSLTTAANMFTCAADLCDVLVTRAGGVKFKKVGDLSISYDPSLYQSLGANLRARGLGHQIPYAGGISVADKRVQQANADAVAPTFSRDQGDNPAAPKPSRPSASNPLTTI